MPRDVPAGLVTCVRRSHAVQVLLATQQIQTADGAARLYWAERTGRARPLVLRAAARRLEQLGGTEPAGALVTLIARSATA